MGRVWFECELQSLCDWRQDAVAILPGQGVWALEVVLGIVTILGELKCLSRPGAGAWARCQRLSESLNSGGLLELPQAGLHWSGADGSGPQRGPLDDLNDPVVGLTSKSRVRVALIPVTDRRNRRTYALGSAGCPEWGNAPRMPWPH